RAERVHTLVDLVGLGPVAVEPDHRELGAAGQARFHAGHPDAGAVQVGPQVQAELVDEGLGRAVDVAPGVRVGAGDRAQVDHVAAAAGDHAGQDGPGAVGQALAVGVDHLVPLVQVGLWSGSQAEGQAGVVDQDVDLGELGRQAGYGIGYRGSVAHLER